MRKVYSQRFLLETIEAGEKRNIFLYWMGSLWESSILFYWTLRSVCVGVQHVSRAHNQKELSLQGETDRGKWYAEKEESPMMSHLLHTFQVKEAGVSGTQRRKRFQ